MRIGGAEGRGKGKAKGKEELAIRQSAAGRVEGEKGGGWVGEQWVCVEENW